MLKKISSEEQKKILVNLLSHINKLCEKNNIKYSLIGGSLIGAIRHKGIIPWDDDIDIILMPDDYSRLLDLLRKDTKYILMEPINTKGYYYPFAKIIDHRTIVKERNFKTIPNYGVYLDIFTYRYISDNRIIQLISYKKQMLLKMLISYQSMNASKIAEMSIAKKIGIQILQLIPSRVIIKKYINLYSHRKTNHIISSWPSYGKNKEIQEAESMQHYTKTNFENMEIMIAKDYDKILKTTFGDYMSIPPKEKRMKHEMDAYWNYYEK